MTKSLLKRKGDIFGTVFIIKIDKAKMFMTSREHNQVLEVQRYYICFSKKCTVFKKTTNNEFCFVAITPQTNLCFLCTYCGFLLKKSSIIKWKMLYFRQMQESSLFSNNEFFSMVRDASKWCLCVSLTKIFKKFLGTLQ